MTIRFEESWSLRRTVLTLDSERSITVDAGGRTTFVGGLFPGPILVRNGGRHVQLDPPVVRVSTLQVISRRKRTEHTLTLADVLEGFTMTRFTWEPMIPLE